MAEIDIENVLRHLENDLKRALEATIEEHFPGVRIDRTAVFKTFVKKARRKCGQFPEIPDEFIE